jgi:hypothetical protein
LLLCALERVDLGPSVLVLSLQLCDAGSLLLAILECLVALGLELILDPLAVATREVELLLEGFFAVLGAAELASGILLSLLKRRNFA